MTDRPLRIEALYRLEAMAVESETWDLSDNDRAAIRRVLDDLAAAGSERDSALRERDEAREALREVQWGGEWSRGIGEEVEQTCPGCGRRRSVGHAEACIVARALASRGDEGDKR